jgi:hypothetical protein
MDEIISSEEQIEMLRIENAQLKLSLKAQSEKMLKDGSLKDWEERVAAEARRADIQQQTAKARGIVIISLTEQIKVLKETERAVRSALEALYMAARWFWAIDYDNPQRISALKGAMLQAGQFVSVEIDVSEVK